MRVCSTFGVHKKSTFHVGAPQSSFVGSRWLGIRVICLVDLSSEWFHTMDVRDTCMGVNLSSHVLFNEFPH